MNISTIIATGMLSAFMMGCSNGNESITSASTSETVTLENKNESDDTLGLKNGEFLAKSSTVAATSQTSNNIGVTPNDAGTCPSNSTKVSITFDEENSNPAFGYSKFHGGWDINTTNGTITQYYCKLNDSDSRMFFRITSLVSYMVLKLGNTCPNNGYTVTRYHDSEDTRNQNSSSGDISPNLVSTKGISLNFCYYPGAKVTTTQFATSISMPSLGTQYGVISNNAGTYQGYVQHDDEDTNNANKLTYETMPATASSYLVNSVITANRNTKYNLGRI